MANRAFGAVQVWRRYSSGIGCTSRTPC